MFKGLLLPWLVPDILLDILTYLHVPVVSQGGYFTAYRREHPYARAA
jgi:hypothetical protein